MPADNVHRCRIRPCTAVKGVTNHWFVSTIDKFGRVLFEKFTSEEAFIKAANKPGALEVCSEHCAHRHLARWMGDKINARDMPECGSSAAFHGNKFTAWVSMVTKETTSKNAPARVVRYMNNGHMEAMWCFNPGVFTSVEQTAGRHVTFKIQRRNGYTCIVDVVEMEREGAYGTAATSATSVHPG
jgi:hypothetical protein